MKALCIVMVSIMVLCGSALAEDLSIEDSLKKLPALKQGIAYSLMEHDIHYLSTLELINWKGIAFEAGYSSKDKVVGVISYELLKLKDLGVTVPVLDLIECRVGTYAGWGRLGVTKGNNEYDYGLSATLINIKF